MRDHQVQLGFASLNFYATVLPRSINSLAVRILTVFERRTYQNLNMKTLCVNRGKTVDLIINLRSFTNQNTENSLVNGNEKK